VIIVERDLRLLAWINGWGAVSVLQIALWLAVDFSTAARRVRKLVAAGLLLRLGAGGLGVQPVALTARGCAIANDSLAPLAGIRIATWRHDSLMVDLEPRILRRFPDAVVHPDRRIRANRALSGAPQGHVPDAELERAGRRPLAFELELSMKAPRRVQAIIDGYASDNTYEAVFYLTTDERVARHVRRFTRGLEDVIKVQVLRPPRATNEESGS
jgi:DNA-binding Lrp family transcriptional regulator